MSTVGKSSSYGLPATDMSDSPSSSLTTRSSSFTSKQPSAQSHRPSDQQSRKSKKADADAAIRAAKLQVRKIVRDDWTWPPTDRESAKLACTFTETAWRERESDSSPCPSPIPGFPALRPPSDPYKFDNPDSLLDVNATRKRKRQYALQEEMEYNEGLCIYQRRRDAWTGAMPVPETPPDSGFESEFSDFVPAVSGSDDSDLSSLSTTNSYLSTACIVGSTQPQPHIARTTDQYLVPLSPPMMVPLPPPILPPSNPIRAAISPSTYPSIYNKIVVQGLSPTIPVNLKDVIGAIVDGWKRDGDWPPKDSEGRVYQGKGAISNGAGGTTVDGIGKALARRGVGRVRRVLGIEKEGGTGDG